MGTRGPTPKPAERKRATGNPGKRPLPAKADLRAVAPVDSSNVMDLTVEQALERSLAAGAAWLAESDIAQVVAAREAAELYAELKADPKTKPADRIAALKAMSAEFGRLGFNPGERAALGLAEVTARSKLEDMRAKQAPVGDRRSTG